MEFDLHYGALRAQRERVFLLWSPDRGECWTTSNCTIPLRGVGRRKWSNHGQSFIDAPLGNLTLATIELEFIQSVRLH